jgi:DNA-binding MurR/RpiR family transcriptional regulator
LAEDWIVYQQRIREVYQYLSPGYQRIADYILNHYREAAFMTAAEVGKAAHVDITSVVRFAQRLGYPGYPELVADIQEDVKKDLRAVYQPLPEGRSPAAVFRRSLIEDRNNLDYMLLHTEEQDIQTILEIIDSATAIYVVGEGAGAYIAELFTARMLALGYNVRTVSSDAAGRIAMVSSIRPGDVLIALGLVDLSPAVSALVKVVREEGVQTLTVTTSPATPAAQAAEHMLYAPAQVDGLMPTVTAVAGVLQALIQALMAKMGEGATEWTLRFEQLYRRYLKVTGEPPLELETILGLRRPWAKDTGEGEGS